MKARWVNWLDVPKEMASHESVAYKTIHVQRNTQFGINRGSLAFILDDPQGYSWVMNSASLIVDPNQAYDSLKNLGSRLKLAAAGDSFRHPELGRVHGGSVCISDPDLAYRKFACGSTENTVNGFF